MKNFLSTLLLTATAFTATAQHPFLTDWRVLKTNNAKIIYPSNIGYDAAKVAQFIDQTFEADNKNINAKIKKLPVILSPTSTTSNGYCTLLPYKTVFYSKPMDDVSLSSMDWYQNLMSHEFRHIVQYNLLNHGLTRLAHCVTGNIGWGSLTYSVPQWYYEGDAVYAETVTSSQGRGRTADFESLLSSILLENNKLYPYDKIAVGSYRDKIPNHYVYGYFMTTSAKRNYGCDVFTKINKRQSWYSFWPWAWGCGFRNITNSSPKQNYLATCNEIKKFYNERQSATMPLNYKKINDTHKSRYTSYLSPMYIDHDKIICIKTSQTDINHLLIIDNKGKTIKDFGRTDCSGFETNGHLLVYATEVPDIRWSEQNFSDIVVVDLKTGKKQTVTHNGKYFSPIISNDSKTIVAVEFTESMECNIVSLKLSEQSNGKLFATVEKTFALNHNEFVRSPKFFGDNEISYISNYHNKNTIKILDFNTLTVRTILNETGENIHDQEPDSEGNIYYTTDRTGINNIFCIDVNGNIHQVTNSRFGASSPNMNDNNMIFNELSRLGYDISVCRKNDYLPEIQPKRSLDYYKPMLEFEKSLSLDAISTQKPDLSILEKSKKYHQYSDPIRFLGWLPQSYDDYLQATFFTQNNLETLDISAAATYNTEFEYFRADFNINYSGFYPVLQLFGSFGENAANYIVSNQFGMINIQELYWREDYFGGSISLPLNFSKYHYGQSAKALLGIEYYNIQHKPTTVQNNWEELPNSKFPVWFSSLSYNCHRNLATRDFQYPWSLTLSLTGYYTPSTEVEARMLDANISATMPGLFRQNYLNISAEYVDQNKSNDIKRMYIFPNEAYNISGYETMRLQKLKTLNASYSFPLGYPDCGIPALIWFKRVRANVFGNVSKGKILQNDLIYQSTGAKILFDFCFARIRYDMTIGVQVARGLKKNGLEQTEWNLLANIPIF